MVAVSMQRGGAVLADSHLFNWINQFQSVLSKLDGMGWNGIHRMHQDESPAGSAGHIRLSPFAEAFSFLCSFVLSLSAAQNSNIT